MKKKESYMLETPSGTLAPDIRKTLGEHHFYEKLSNKMREKKELLGFSDNQLSASTGIPKKDISAFFTGEAWLQLETLRNLAHGLHMEIDVVDKENK